MVRSLFRQVFSLLCLAALLAACGVQASTGPTGTPTTLPTPTIPHLPTTQPSATPAPSDTLPTPGETKTITLDNNGQTITLATDETFLLKLGDTMDWTVDIADQSIVSRVPNVALTRAAQGLYRAHKAGVTKLQATGDPPCRKAQPACASPSLLFTLQIVAQGPATSSAGNPIAMTFINAKQGWVITSAGESTGPYTLLATNDGGATWQQRYTSTISLEQVVFVSSQNGWLLARGLSTCSGATVSCPSTLLATKDGGQSWQKLDIGAIAFVQVQFLDATNGWAIVHRAAQATDSINNVELRQTRDGGSTWTSVGLENVMPAKFTFPTSFTFTDAQHGWVAGMVCKDVTAVACFAIVMATSDGGKTWQQQDVAQAPADAVPQTISFSDQEHGWLLETVFNMCTMGGCWGPLFATSDGGRTWNLLQTNQQWKLSGATDAPPGFPGRPLFVSPLVGWIPVSPGAGQGAGGLALTDDGGKTWMRLGSDKGWDISMISAVSPSELWLVGRRQETNGVVSFLAHSSDGGHTWTQQLPPP